MSGVITQTSSEVCTQYSDVVDMARSVSEIGQDLVGISLDMNPNLTSAQAAAFLGVKTATLSDWRYRGRGPRYVKMGRRVHYRYSDIIEFRNKCLV